jgi:hypothetical protein
MHLFEQKSPQNPPQFRKEIDLGFRLAHTGYSGGVGAIMRSTVFAAAASSVAALVGFAGAANASATIDLIWADSGTDTTSIASTSSIITLQVILTAGPNGSQGAGVSVDYGATKGKLVVLGYASTASGSALPFTLGDTIDTGTRIENINSVALPPLIGTGLAAGQSHQLGTVTFHKSVLINTTFEIRSDADGPLDAVLRLDGVEIQDTTTFNSAFLNNFHVHEPDFDGDGIADNLDNCSVAQNPDQVDTDADDCGNLCDADYNQNGRVDTGDFGFFLRECFGQNNQLCQHTPPINSTTLVSIADFGFFLQNFGGVPGPSGLTAGTTACP